MMMETPDGPRRLELVKFHAPPGPVGDRHAPANTPGLRHLAGFAVDDIDAVVAGLRARGAELVGEVERYEDIYRLCYVRGPEGYHRRACGADRLNGSGQPPEPRPTEARKSLPSVSESLSACYRPLRAVTGRVSRRRRERGE